MSEERCTATVRVTDAQAGTHVLRCTKPEGHEHPLAPHDFDLSCLPPMRSDETITFRSWTYVDTLEA